VWNAGWVGVTGHLQSHWAISAFSDTLSENAARLWSPNDWSQFVDLENECPNIHLSQYADICGKLYPRAVHFRLVCGANLPLKDELTRSMRMIALSPQPSHTDEIYIQLLAWAKQDVLPPSTIRRSKTWQTVSAGRYRFKCRQKGRKYAWNQAEWIVPGNYDVDIQRLRGLTATGIIR